jgi:hypothetical protein
MSAIVKGFGCRPLPNVATGSGGRRPKASKGGNRGRGNVWAAAMGYGDLSAADMVSAR